MTQTTQAPSFRVLSAVQDLLPQLQRSVEASDRDRHVPSDVVAALRSAGAYRVYVPRELGGDEQDLRTFLDVVEIVSQGNAAAGWDLATSNWLGMAALTLSQEGAARVYERGPDVTFTGGGAGGGQAVPEDDGYRLTGHWRFGSGSMEADWMVALACRVGDAAGPRLNGNGEQEMRIALLPRSDFVIDETWDVAGLQGTGSNDLDVRDARVPEALTQLAGAPSPWAGPLYRLPPGTVINAIHLSSVATGIARCAIDSLVQLAKEKTPTLSQSLLRERVQVQEAVARAEALLESARAYRDVVVAEIWATAEAGIPATVAQRARLRLAGVSATEAAVRAVDLMYAAGGTTAIENRSPLSHCFRDIHVVAQNINVLPLLYENIGRVMLDLEAGSRLIAR